MPVNFCLFFLPLLSCTYKCVSFARQSFISDWGGWSKEDVRFLNIARIYPDCGVIRFSPNAPHELSLQLLTNHKVGSCPQNVSELKSWLSTYDLLLSIPRTAFWQLSHWIYLQSMCQRRIDLPPFDWNFMSYILLLWGGVRIALPLENVQFYIEGPDFYCDT